MINYNFVEQLKLIDCLFCKHPLKHIASPTILSYGEYKVLDAPGAPRVIGSKPIYSSQILALCKCSASFKILMHEPLSLTIRGPFTSSNFKDYHSFKCAMYFENGTLTRIGFKSKFKQRNIIDFKNYENTSLNDGLKDIVKFYNKNLEKIKTLQIFS